MPLVVRAEVVDLRTDSPKPTDVFAVDTNVWYWLTYQPASQSARPYQITQYPNFLKRAKNIGGKLRYCGTVFAELAHLIEVAEYKSYCARHGIQPNAYGSLTAKDFRHDYPQDRVNVQDEVAIAWGQVTSMADIAAVQLDSTTITASATMFDQVCLDGYDLITVEAMRDNGIRHIITDDKDFLTVPGIVVLTANNNAVQTAKTAGKLITR